MPKSLSRPSSPVAVVCLLAASVSFTVPASADEDWRALWPRVLPAVEAPADVTEAEEVFWTYYVEGDTGARICLGAAEVLTGTYSRLSAAGTATPESAEMVRAVLDYCEGVIAGSAGRKALFNALMQAQLAESTALMQKASRGKPIPYSIVELELTNRRFLRREAHLERWKAEKQ